MYVTLFLKNYRWLLKKWHPNMRKPGSQTSLLKHVDIYDETARNPQFSINMFCHSNSHKSTNYSITIVDNLNPFNLGRGHFYTFLIPYPNYLPSTCTNCHGFEHCLHQHHCLLGTLLGWVQIRSIYNVQQTICPSADLYLSAVSWKESLQVCKVWHCVKLVEKKI